MTEVKEKNYIMDICEWFYKYKRKSNKCEKCGKHYKLPTYIFEPRDKICATCEMKMQYNLEESA